MRKKILVILLSGIISFQSQAQSLDDLNDMVNAANYLDESRFVGPGDYSRQASSSEVSQLGSMFENLQNQVSELQSTFEHLNSMISAMGSGVALIGALRTLDNQECAPDFQLGAGALMPSSCLSSGNRRAGECQSCYEGAVTRLQTVRRGMARMRCVYMNTKNFKDKALSFGDNIAGLHGAMGMVWQGQRKGIEDSYKRFTQAYDRKYTDFIGSLHEALLAVNTCENQFGTRDWYQRFGFMFEEIMKEKYKRSD